MQEYLDIKKIKEALEIINQSGYYFIPNIYHDCGCKVEKGIMSSCNYHHKQLKNIISQTRSIKKPETIFGIKIFTSK